jgi:hypothetical protein
LPTRWPVLDGELTNAYERIVLLDEKIAGMVKQLGKDEPEDYPEYLATEDARYDAIDILSAVPAISCAGMKAKASALKLQSVADDYERAGAIADSLTDDILAMADMGAPQGAPETV